MKRIQRLLLAATLLGLSGLANANLSFLSSGSATRTEVFNLAGLPNFAVGTSLSLGSLVTNSPGVFSFTYLGEESGFMNSLHLSNGLNLFETHAVGTSINATMAGTGALPFSFVEIVSPSPSASAQNGGAWSPNTSIGLIGTNLSVLGKTYAFVLGYNDSAGPATLGDWDDFVIGVNVVSQVPEPGVYGMLAAGLGMLGWVGRRRKQSEVA